MQILHSRILGAGKPLLILHGYFGMGDNWKTHANKLAEDGFEVHLIDQRNHGRSFHSDAFDYELMVDDLHDYITHYHLENIVLLGHSMGGKTAMLFATQYPELVDKLIVADISPKMYPPHHQAILSALNSVDFTVQNSRNLIDDKLAELIPELGIRQFLLKSVYRKTKTDFAFRFNLASLTENNNEVGAALPSFTIFEGDTLFLKGENSGYISEDEVPLIEAHFPKAIIKSISNAGHWLHAENPKDFYAQVIGFIQGK
ncbi:alpha/beta fold hydrolase [Tenacibaculum finnmarkense]|uniref:Alpha/beta hydrolase n=1 Tax=Tenacibaculum finnmarkense genomovar ulcerans TaxID=2781388 RepID=A0A2I2MAP7_9FLAO|nr:alpha/beta fold hydrolase [Tenacibaculum finnmarkense]MBE7698075.1 alpha/beta fold hydrolase [Tenacibaculum finnmarkense genomovar ulcerans]MCG8749847.1 alpha/beta fold hydrolase [Tenacibaculum finnmarkense]MCG8755072.1 alpha/beta fold hydrolase [Tenacibaculum finnmarkense]MCG8783447.1 alpha/beta fold hydrolase [Tenacibaculum finnmarkense]MCG8785580.1 alpha/beta fold hydrolase [Tenacibaculum finnmarkense]